MTAVGTALSEWRLEAVDAERMKVLALLLADPNPLHFDTASVRAAGLGDRPVNQGPSSMAMLVNAVRATWPGARLLRLEVELRGSVAAGDEVVVRGEVTAREDTDAGETVCCALVLESGARTVLRGRADVLLPR